jgi:hypothetical protein
MKFVKERNLIVAYDYSLKVGAWDITTGQFIGKSGKPVKSVPQCFTFRYLPSWRSDNLLGYAIYWYRNKFTHDYDPDYDEEKGARFEQLLSLGLFPNDPETLNNKLNLTKKIVDYVKEECNSYYNAYRVNKYLTMIQYEQYVNTLPDWAKEVFAGLFNADFPIDYIKTVLNRVINEHVEAMYEGYNQASYIEEMLAWYYKTSMKMFGKVEVEKNFLTKYAVLKYLEAEYKKAHYNEELAKNNDKKWLYYENDTFIVKPLLTKEDFHKEGEAQRNCVERLYMEKVYKGSTHVVTVRLKTNPDKSYITCEVANDGRIYQYLAFGNSTPSDGAARDFKNEYQQHLKANYEKN